MNKGGIGKTIVSMNLIQYLRDKKRTVHAIDLDPMNHTLIEYHGIQARPVDLFSAGHAEFRGDEIDALAQSLLTDDASFVLDNGAAGFIRFGAYLAETDFSTLLSEHGRDLILHAVIGGGDMTAQCIMGLHSMMTAFPASVPIVVWLNEHPGPVEFEGMPFEDMKIYQDNRSRFAGIVHLPRLSPLFLQDFNRMLARRLSYEEAITSPDFHIMNKQRLVMTRRAVWNQLAELPL